MTDLECMRELVAYNHQVEDWLNLTSDHVEASTRLLRFIDSPNAEEVLAKIVARYAGSRTTGPGRHHAADAGYSPFPERRGTKYEDDNWPKFRNEAQAVLALLARQAVGGASS